MDSSNDQRASSGTMQPRVEQEWISDTGWALIWIDAILLVPAIFGVMFLPLVIRLLLLSVGIALVGTYVILYTWARTHPRSTSAHLLQALHFIPRRITR